MQVDEFEKADAGLSLTYPEQAVSLKKGDYCMIKDHPCKISDKTTTQAGKHGHTKTSIIGYDVFTNKKYEDSFPSSYKVRVPFVTKTEQTILNIFVKKRYHVVHIQQDWFLVLMGVNGIIREDLRMPEGEDDFELSKQIKIIISRNIFHRNVFVSVLSAMGEEKIVYVREIQ